MGMTFDFGQLVLDNEVAQMVKRAVNGIPVNDEALAVDIIKEIGIGKDFLSHESTYHHMRSISAPKIFDRTIRENWEQSTSRDIYKKATLKARDVLKTHIPERPPPPCSTTCAPESSTARPSSIGTPSTPATFQRRSPASTSTTSRPHSTPISNHERLRRHAGVQCRSHGFPEPGKPAGANLPVHGNRGRQ